MFTVDKGLLAELCPAINLHHSTRFANPRPDPHSVRADGQWRNRAGHFPTSPPIFNNHVANFKSTVASPAPKTHQIPEGRIIQHRPLSEIDPRCPAPRYITNFRPRHALPTGTGANLPKPGPHRPADHVSHRPIRHRTSSRVLARRKHGRPASHIDRCRGAVGAAKRGGVQSRESEIVAGKSGLSRLK